MRAALAFFSVVIVSLLGLLAADTIFAGTLATPIAGTWSGGGHQFQVAGTLEGGFTISAASSWKVFGCPINSGDVLFRYVAKGGSSYDLTWIVVWATTTQGQEGVKCENTYEGPKAVTVTRSASGALNIACIGSACSSTGALKLVGSAPKPPTTAPPKKDASPPQVHALVKGLTEPASSSKLQFRVKDDSGRARVTIKLFEGGAYVRTLPGGWGPANGSTQGRDVLFASSLVGPMYFCAVAEDQAGNRSAKSCAWISLRVSVKKVSNGCGGGWDALVKVQNYFGNKHTYQQSLGRSYTVNFADACNIHDAAYGGHTVEDKINGGPPIDFHSWSRPRIDRKFLGDMRALCTSKIPASAKNAREKRYSTGGTLSIGALALANFVEKHGWRFFDADPTVPDIQKRGPRANFD